MSNVAKIGWITVVVVGIVFIILRYIKYRREKNNMNWFRQHWPKYYETRKIIHHCDFLDVKSITISDKRICYYKHKKEEYSIVYIDEWLSMTDDIVKELKPYLDKMGVKITDNRNK